MPVTTHTGNLLDSDCEILVHQANCFATMGAGIAKQIAHRHPEALLADRTYKIPVGSKARLGQFSHVWVNGPSGRRMIVNLYAQYNYGRGKQTNTEAFEAGINHLFESIQHSAHKDAVIGIPYNIGCGLAGGNWPEIEAIINRAANRYQLTVHLYRFNPGKNK